MHPKPSSHSGRIVGNPSLIGKVRFARVPSLIAYTSVVQSHAAPTKRETRVLRNYETAQDRHSFGRVHGPHRIAGLLGARPDKLPPPSPARTATRNGILRLPQPRPLP